MSYTAQVYTPALCNSLACGSKVRVADVDKVQTRTHADDLGIHSIVTVVVATAAVGGSLNETLLSRREHNDVDKEAAQMGYHTHHRIYLLK